MKRLMLVLLVLAFVAGCGQPPAAVKSALYASQATIHKNVGTMQDQVNVTPSAETDGQRAERLANVLRDSIVLETAVDLNLQAVAEYYESGRLTDPATVGEVQP